MKHGCSHSGSHSGYAIIQKYFIWSLLEWSHECILPILLSFDSLFFKLIIITLREIYVEHLLYAWKCRENIMAIISFNSHNSPMRLVLFFHIFPEEEINMRQIKWHKQGHRPASGMSRVNFFFFYSREDVFLTRRPQKLLLLSFQYALQNADYLLYLLVLGLCLACVLSPAAFPDLHALSVLFFSLLSRILS